MTKYDKLTLDKDLIKTHMDEYPINSITVELNYEDVLGLSWKERNKLKIKLVDGKYLLKINKKV